MKNSKREIEYAKEHFNEVHHTTLNPEGPGVVRIHLIPPVIDSEEIGPSIAIINGQDILPIGPSWSILLSEFIEEVNVYDGKPITEEDFKTIENATFKRMKKIYPLVPKSFFRNDLFRMMDTFKRVAYREPVDEEIGFLSIGDYSPYMKAPHRMDLMVSAMEKEGEWNCNQRCVHCYRPDRGIRRNPNFPQRNGLRLLKNAGRSEFPSLPLPAANRPCVTIYLN